MSHTRSKYTPKSRSEGPRSETTGSKRVILRLLLNFPANIVILLPVWVLLGIIVYFAFWHWNKATTEPVNSAELTSRTVYIQADDAFVQGLVLPPTKWHFPGMSRLDSFMLMEGFGVTNATIFAPFAETNEEGTTITPPAHLVSSIDQYVRAKFYKWLGDKPGNPEMEYPFTFSMGRLEQRFSKVSPETYKQVSKFFYPGTAGRIFLADAAAACEGLSNEERVAFIKAISEQETLLLTMRIDKDSDLDAISERWSNPNVTRDYLPLLRSIRDSSDGAVQLDILHLLPKFAKGLAYTYPAHDMPFPEVAKDCFWTAMNFHASVPDYGLNSDTIQSLLNNNYGILEEGVPPRFGDLMVYFSPKGTSIHVSIYITDEIVFTKNGTSVLSPWIFMKRKSMEAFYPQLDGATVQFIRNTVQY